MNVTIEKMPDGSLYLTGLNGDEFLQAVAEKGAEGYTVLQGTTQLNMYIKRCVMALKESVQTPAEALYDASESDKEIDKTGEQEPVQTPTEPAKVTAKYSQAMVTSFKGNKNKLEQYGRELGVELKKSKSFENMVKDLEDFVAFPITN